jgi:hypothetical protein
MDEAGGGLLENSPCKTLLADAGEASPPAFAALNLHSRPRLLFVFCFERDLHGLFLRLFQKVELLRKIES